ncbi:MAG: FAD-binding protein [Candidatus Odyssella sp.]|nr:FAD-binding protein [Candidatus Odyssella sp.]
MNVAATAPAKKTAPGDGALAQRLRRAIAGEVLFDAGARGRYSTDASIYQIEPIGVVVPKTDDDLRAALAIAREERLPVLPRGAGTSQCGQTVGAALVIDGSKYLDKIVAFDKEARTVTVEPGIVLDRLNAWLRPHGLWFPVDVSTSAQATIGGMAGNNSCGARSIEYGNMVHNVLGVDAILADGTEAHFGPLDDARKSNVLAPIAARLEAIALAERDEIALRYPKVLRRVGGYNLDIFHPQSVRPYTADGTVNLAHLLVGSEGTLAYSRRVALKLAPLPKHKVLGVVNFPSFHQAMALTQHIVKLAPTAVELVDRTMIDLARENPAFRPIVDAALIGRPEALLLAEFAGEDRNEQRARLEDLVALMGDLGLPGSVVEMTEPAPQRDLWEVRKAGLNIMMSMKGDGKPVSFIEDCAVPLEHLADYTQRLTDVFAKHGTKGTWYAHASVGTLHVRPILDMRRDGAVKMRAIAEEAAAMVREYKGAYSGEHGDGLVRSEWVAWQFGPRLARAFEAVKAALDPEGRMNPGKIVRPPKMDDRSLFRFAPGYATPPQETALDWSEWATRENANGFAAAVEMCNNNGHCRKFDAGTMCPSYRVTRDEAHLTRGRANTLRLALSGQLGPDALAADAVAEALDLCVSCKGCKRECPTGVDMARMKTEVQYRRAQRNGLRRFDKLVAYLPRYAPRAAKLAWLLNLRDRLPGARALGEKVLGVAAKRSLPRWRKDTFLGRVGARGARPADAAESLTDSYEGARSAPLRGEARLEAALFVDTFSNYFEPENARAALKVLEAAGYRVHVLAPERGGRPLCCGRTFLAAGLADEAKAEARRTLAALAPLAARGVPILGLEPSCLFSFRDEFQAMGLGAEAKALAGQTFMFEEFLAREKKAGRLALKLKPLPAKRALLHGHCHQKAFDAMRPVQAVLALIPELEIEPIESSCCGMAGAFGYEAKHYEASMAMGELALLPAVRKAGPGDIVVADGTSCRHQIKDGARREALHVARVLEMALAA